MNKIESMIEEVEQLNANTPDGIVVDCDTILADLIECADFKYYGWKQKKRNSNLIDDWSSGYINFLIAGRLVTFRRSISYRYG